jgi:hypothetical protein
MVASVIKQSHHNVVIMRKDICTSLIFGTPFILLWPGHYIFLRVLLTTTHRVVFKDTIIKIFTLNELLYSIIIHIFSF